MQLQTSIVPAHFLDSGNRFWTSQVGTLPRRRRFRTIITPMEPEIPPPTDFPAPGPGPDRPRRPRYRGTHPRAFSERYKELSPEAHPDIHDHVRSQGRTPAGTHVPVMVEEVISVLAPALREWAADCTLGHGGHALAILDRIGPTGRLIGLDLDEAELARTRDRLADAGWASACGLHRCHYAGLGKVLAADGVGGVDLVLADLGVSSMQLDNPARGFSYKHDGPLDMRMNARTRRTAADWLAALSEQELTAALEDLSDEPQARRIARAIIRERSQRAITRTAHLVRVIESSLAATRPPRRSAAQTGRGARTPAARIREDEPERQSDTDLHPAARTFQALRILVNDELTGLEQFLRAAPYCLRPNGRIGVISFHSGEDQRVEDSFRRGLEDGLFAAISESPIRPGPLERRDNPRCASARFRWARKPTILPA
jgi:16S rRNA (cytosine1402-N4)-methyltransferase